MGEDIIKVSELINGDRRKWDEVLISRLFNPSEAKSIYSIPICSTRRGDRLVWHHSKNGKYQVKSGYKISRNLKECSDHTSSSSHRNRRIWKWLWALSVPTKIKNTTNQSPGLSLSHENKMKANEVWSPPAHGYVKTNSDALIMTDEGAGMGVVIHDDRGIVIETSYRFQSNLFDVEVAEALACRDDVFLARSLGLKNKTARNQIPFESDTMRNQWLRLLLIRCNTPSQPYISQVHHLRSLTSSLLHSRAPHVTPKPFVFSHHFTSSPELAVEPPKTPSDQATLLADIFATPGRSSDEIKLDLDLKNVVITYDLILSFLRNPDTDPDVAKRVFDWVLETQSEKLSSKSYNLMLGILVRGGFVKETWDMIGIMKKKGYGVVKGAFVKISERFQKDGLDDDVEKLKELYASGSASCKKTDGSKENAVDLDMNVRYSSDLVTRVLENLEMEPNKALIFFRWVQESGLFKHDERSFNAMARVLGDEDHSQKFWRKMIKDAVDLYEFAMIGANKPSAQDCIFLLKKIVVSKELDMDLFLKVVGVFKANGYVLTNANLDAVIKSLTSVGRMTECNKILVAMEEAGYVPSGSSRCKIAFKLSSGGKTDEALEFMNHVAAPDFRTWESLVKGYCVARDLDEASNSFRKMVEKEGPSCAGHALDVLIGTYCRKNRPVDAYKFVLEMYLSRTGSAEEATVFLQAMTVKRFPATPVFLRLFEAYFKAGRQNEAQNFLSKCPGYIKNHADVLNLFCSRNSRVTRNEAVSV
ncbi:hypothetical protein DH2020_009187 [Rehmannia glutinosa]|uniref:Pentatricopeptide repeat-containing protein n=1 Tax=Rehmannia glutinosa TaxID=99300 RepID=A0ABR0X8U9_REHGL